MKMEHEKSPSEYKEANMSREEFDLCAIEQWIKDAEKIRAKRRKALIDSGKPLIKHTLVESSEIIDREMARSSAIINHLSLPESIEEIWVAIFDGANVPIPMKMKKGYLRSNTNKKEEEEQ
jgi:hypothetical protein